MLEEQRAEISEREKREREKKIDEMQKQKRREERKMISIADRY